MIRTKSRREQRSGEGVNSSYCETPKPSEIEKKKCKKQILKRTKAVFGVVASDCSSVLSAATLAPLDASSIGASIGAASGF